MGTLAPSFEQRLHHLSGLSRVWWHTPVIPAFGRQGQVNFCEFQSSQNYTVRTLSQGVCLRGAGEQGDQNKTTVFMPSCCLNCFYFNFLKWKLQSFPFGIAFMMRPQFYTTKFYSKQLTFCWRWALLQSLGLPRRHPSCCWAASPSVLSLELLFPLLLRAANGIFLISTVS